MVVLGLKLMELGYHVKIVLLAASDCKPSDLISSLVCSADTVGHITFQQQEFILLTNNYGTFGNLFC